MGNNRVALADCEIDLATCQYVRGGAVLRLSANEARLVAYFVDNPRRDIPREELLTSVFGYSENVQSRTIDTTIQRLRKKIEADPTDPRHILTVQGIGYRFEPLMAPTPSFFPSGIGIEIPDEQDRFFGRKAARSVVLQHLEAGSNLITIVGPGGVGKTRFAHWFAMTVTDRWTCCTVDVSEARTARDLVQATLSALHSRCPQDENPSYVIARILDQRPMLVVLDGFEHIIEQADLLTEWVSSTTKSRMLVTSRIRLNQPAETVVTLDPLSESEAMALFLARGRAIRPDFAQAVDLDALRDVVKHLDCMPLAIELAAARAKAYRPADLLTVLQRGFDLLHESGDQGAALEGAIQWSWDQLTPWERALLSQATIFRGDFDIPAAEAVLSLPPDGPPVVDVLESVIDQSLLQAQSGPQGVRVRFLGTIRDFAERQVEQETRDQMAESHAAHFLRIGEEWAESAFLWDPVSIAKLAASYDNIASIAERGPPIQRLRARLSLAAVHIVRGITHKQVSELENAIRAAEPLPAWIVPKAMLAITDQMITVGRRAEAWPLYERGIAAAEGDPAARLQLAARAGWMAMTTGDDSAASRFEAVIEEATRIGKELHGVTAGLGLAAMALRELRLDEAEFHAMRVANLLEDYGLEGARIDAVKVLAYVSEIRGDFDEASAHYEALIEEAEQGNNPVVLGVQLASFGRAIALLSDDEGDRIRAREILGRAADVEQSFGARVPTPHRVQAEALLLWDSGDLEAARRIVQQRLDATRSYGPLGVDGDLVGMLADIALDTGDLETARLRFDEVFTLPGTRQATVLAHGGRALVHARSGDLDHARADLQAAIESGHSPVLQAVNQALSATIDLMSVNDPALRPAAEAAAEQQLKRTTTHRLRRCFFVRQAARRLTEALQRK